MFDQSKSQRFQELRELQLSRQISGQQAAELSLLERRLLAEEARTLHDSTERLQRERKTVDAQNREIEEVLLGKSALERRLRNAIREFRAKPVAARIGLF